MKTRDSLRRRGPTRSPKPRFLIVCEGEVTEPRYFRQMRHLLKSLIELEILPGGDPKILVERAVQRRKEADKAANQKHDSYLTYDQVWCVCDVDEHSRLNDALQQARDNGIDVALSNPCFELWALLHFQDQTAYIERGTVQHLCRVHMPRYNKELPCETLLERHPEAAERAVRLDQLHELQGTHGGNPSTGVYRLVAEIKRQSQL
jgi:hypothetical protein